MSEANEVGKEGPGGLGRPVKRAGNDKSAYLQGMGIFCWGLRKEFNCEGRQEGMAE